MTQVDFVKSVGSVAPSVNINDVAIFPQIQNQMSPKVVEDVSTPDRST